MERQLVTTETSETVTRTVYHRALLSPCPTPARTGTFYQRLATYRDIPHILRSAASSAFLAVDFETKGTDYSWNFMPDPTGQAVTVVGIGLAWDKGSAYLPWNELYTSSREAILDMLRAHPGLLAHNVYFDGGVMETLVGDRSVTWHTCTLALYRLLSNEGWAGQQHGLKLAMREILLWEDTNEEGIDTWLVTHGYYKGNARKDTTPEVLIASYREGVLKPDKAEMWRVPHDILGQYCVLDAEATYLLYTEHLLPVLRKFPRLEEDFRKHWMHLIALHIHQKIHGIRMDTAGLEARREALLETMSRLEKEFLSRPDVAPHVEAMEQLMLGELAAKEPPRYKKLAERPAEPPRYKKNGQQSKNWETWVENGPRYTVPVQSLTWVAWHERWTEAVGRKNPDYLLNIQSGRQLGELLYDRMGHEVRIRTESGLYGTGADALKHMGEAGRLLCDRDDALKELGFIAKYLDLCEFRDSIHPSFGLPGTSTGRLSSKEPNLQQVKKTKAMMDLFVARPGHTWIDLDFHALEPVVTTEFSGDKNMEAIYGNGSKPNDIYLFVAYTVPQWRADLDRVGYNPYSPSKETVAAAKADPVTKHIRKIAKVVVLACAYGAGVDKILENLTNDGVKVTKDDVAEVHRGYWELFARVKAFGYELQDLWWETVDLPHDLKEQYKSWGRSKAKRDRIPNEIVGYIMNGLGRPMCVTHDYKKDALNRFIQSTGHDILVRYIYLVSKELDHRGIAWYPLVIDWHDAMAIEVPDDQVEAAISVYMDSLDELNRQLGGDIRLKGVPSMGKNMSAIKEPEE